MKNLSILVGVGSKHEIEPLVQDGATEFYTGLGMSTEIKFSNARYEVDICNLKNAKELTKTAKRCHKYKKNLFLAINYPIYKQGTHKQIAQTMLQLLDTGLDGFIIIDFYLMYEFSKQLKKTKRKTKIHLSGGISAFNKMELQFFKQFNVSRVLLPQHLYSHEAIDFFNDPDIETEIFYHLGSHCNYVMGRCHMSNLALFEERKIITHFPCFYKYNILNWQEIKVAPEIYDRWCNIWVNDLGNLYDSIKLGINSIKLGTRGTTMETTREMLQGLVKTIRIANKAKNKKSFLKTMENETSIRKDDFYMLSNTHFRFLDQIRDAYCK